MNIHKSIARPRTLRCKRPAVLLTLISFMYAALFIPAVHAVQIDDFTTAQGPVVAGPSNTVSGGGILDGVRRVSVAPTGAVLTVSGGALHLTATDGPAEAALGYGHVDVFDPSVDLTGGGAANAFLIDVTGLAGGPAGWFVWGNTEKGVYSSAFQTINSPGIQAIPFSEIASQPGFPPGVDFTDVIAVFLTIFNLPKDGSITVASFSTGVGGAPDADGDGIADASDLCPDTGPVPVDAAGCSDAQVDVDGDGYCNVGAPSSGPSACAGTDNCPTVSNPGQIDSNGDGFGDACVDPSVEIPGNADVDPTAIVGAGSGIDKGVMIGPGVEIGENVSLDKNVAVGENTTVGDGTAVDRNATLGAGVMIGDDVSIGQGVVIDDGAVIGDRSVINRGVFIGADAVVETYVVIGRNSVICPTARVESALTLGKNAFVDTGVVQMTDMGGSATPVDPVQCVVLP